MELHQIRAFVTVARVGNVTKASDVLCVTQPAVTAQIKGLESSLGVALFDRSGGHIKLTRAGEKLLALAGTLLAAAAEFKARVQARRVWAAQEDALRAAAAAEFYVPGT